MSKPAELVLDAPVRRFRPYPEYKDSGVEWLGEIPKHWKALRWRYLCRISEGQVAPDDKFYSNHILIAPNHVESGTGRILFTETAHMQGASSGKYTVRAGDIIYSKIRPALNKACIAEGDWLCSADMYPIRIVTPELKTKFLLHFMLSEPFVRFMVDESMRVAMPKVNRETLSTCSVLVPPITEQAMINAFLSRETAKIDALIAKKERLIELLQEKRTALVTQAVTRGVDPDVPIKDSGMEWLGEIPAHWEPKRVVDVAESLQTGPFGSQLHSDDYISYGVPVINPAHLKDSRIMPDWNCSVDEPTAQRLRLHRLLAGDIVLGRRGELGRSALTTPAEEGWLCGTGSLRLRLRSAVSDPRFFGMLFMSERIRDWLSLQSIGSTMQNLNTSIIGRVPVAVPPLVEQNAIVEHLQRELGQIDQLVGCIHRGLDRLKELRTALISAAVTGKIDVRGEVA